MIESLVAISVGMFGLLGILTLVSKSMSMQNDLNHQFVANYLAAEGVELVRSGIDEFYSAGTEGAWTGAQAGFEPNKKYQISYDGTWTEFSGTAPDDLDFLYIQGGLYGYFSPDADTVETIFKREIEVIKSDEVSIQVISSVFWEDRGELETISLENVFYNWR